MLLLALIVVNNVFKNSEFIKHEYWIVEFFHMKFITSALAISIKVVFSLNDLFKTP